MPAMLPIRLFLCLTLTLSSVSCTRLFFFPQASLVRTPATLGFEYEDAYPVTRDGVRLHGWWIQPQTEPVGSVYFLHGNAENISTHIGSVLWMVDKGYQVLMLDYRGFGLSEGVPGVPEVLEDIRAGAHWLFVQQPRRPLIIFGQSLGGSLSISALHRYPEMAAKIDGLISEAAFSRFGTIGREVAARNWLSWPFQYPVGWLLNNEHDPIDAIASLKMPKLLIHSVDDEVIGPHHARDLFQAAIGSSQLLETTGPHIQALSEASNRQQILRFIQALGDSEQRM